MTKRSKNWFFIITNILRIDNTWGGVRFRKRDKPTQETMKDFCDSITFKEEPGDKATNNVQGLVKTVSDANAIDGIEPDTDYTYVPKISQIPTVEAISSIIDDFEGNTLDVTPEVVTTTRNNYQTKLSSSFTSWLLSKLNSTSIDTSYSALTIGATTTWDTESKNFSNKTLNITTMDTTLNIINAVSGTSGFLEIINLNPSTDRLLTLPSGFNDRILNNGKSKTILIPKTLSENSDDALITCIQFTYTGSRYIWEVGAE